MKRREEQAGFWSPPVEMRAGYSNWLKAKTFNPLSLSPALWLDAADATTLYQSNGGSLATADGDPVGYWMDKSGNGYHASQTSGSNKPVLKTAIKNGKNIVRANGSSAFLNLTSFPYPMPFTMYVVYKKNASGSVFVPLAHSSDSLTHIGESWSDNVFYGRSDASGITNNGYLSSAQINDYSNYVVCDVSANSGIAALNLNGTSITISNVATRVMQSILNTIFKSNADFSNGDLCEILVYLQSHNSSNKSLLRSYLNSKWGIY